MKIFCIGYNKTGTTSLTHLMNKNNLPTAPLRPFECNLDSLIYGNFNVIVEMIKNEYNDYVFFQDAPFCFPNLYKELDKEFRDAKFILSVRDNEDEWYNSLIRFYKKFFSEEDFKNPKKNRYVYEGWMYRALTMMFTGNKNNPYHEESLKNGYIKHNLEVIEYFKNKDNLLIVNLKEEKTVEKIENFIGLEFTHKKMPHLNRTK